MSFAPLQVTGVCASTQGPTSSPLFGLWRIQKIDNGTRFGGEGRAQSTPCSSTWSREHISIRAHTLTLTPTSSAPWVMIQRGGVCAQLPVETASDPRSNQSLVQWLRSQGRLGEENLAYLTIPAYGSPVTSNRQHAETEDLLHLASSWNRSRSLLESLARSVFFFCPSSSAHAGTLIRLASASEAAWKNIGSATLPQKKGEKKGHTTTAAGAAE